MNPMIARASFACPLEQVAEPYSELAVMVFPRMRQTASPLPTLISHTIVLFFCATRAPVDE